MQLVGPHSEPYRKPCACVNYCWELATVSTPEEDWFEVWAEDKSPRPPYLLIVRPDPVSPSRYQVIDPNDGESVVFTNEDYGAVRNYLLEDEFGMVQGRTNIGDL